MDVSNFTATGGKVATVPMPSSNVSPMVLPQSMREQPMPTGIEEAAPAASADTAAPTVEATGESAPAADSAPATAAPATESKPARVDPRFSALARKEAQLVRERQAITAEKAALEAAHRQVVAFEEARNAAKNDPLAVLSALGLTYDDVTAKALGVEKPTTPEAQIEAVRSELERFREEQATAAKQAEEAKAAALEAERQTIIETFRRDAVAHVDANAERYELTRLNNAASLVPQVVEQHFAATGKLLTAEQAADLVEKHFEVLADRIVTARKVQARTEAKKPAPAPKPPPPAANVPAPAAPAKTLSNALTASTSSTPSKVRTDQDRIRAALARLNE